MYIITVLTVATHEEEVISAFNEELIAQDQYLRLVNTLSHPEEDTSILYDSLLISINKAIIYKRAPGWTGYYKDLYKIVTLHYMPDYVLSDGPDS